MDDGGSGVLTPEMVLAAAEPPPEAPGARSARAMGIGFRICTKFSTIPVRGLDTECKFFSEICTKFTY